MTKTQIKSLPYWLVIGLVSILAIGSAVWSFSGSAQNVAENGGVINVYNEGGGMSLGASGTRFPSGISADSTAPSSGQVRGTSLIASSQIGVNTTTLTGEINVDGGSATSSLTLDTDGTEGACIMMADADGDLTALYLTANGSIATSTADCR